MSLDAAVNGLVTLAVMEMMFVIGLGLALYDLMAVARNGRRLGRAFVANYLLVPAVTIVLLCLFQTGPMAAAGFLVLAACPGAPFIPPLTALAGGHVASSVGFMIMLAGSSAVLAPVMLSVLVPWFSGGIVLSIDPARLVSTLFLVQLIPLGAGIGLRHFRPAFAARVMKPARRLGFVLSTAAVVLILIADFPLLAAVSLKAVAGMLILLAASLAAGWLMAAGDLKDRKTLALTTALRNVGVGLVIATGAFPGTPIATAVLAYGLVGILGSLGIAAVWHRKAAIPAAVVQAGAAVLVNPGEE